MRTLTNALHAARCSPCLLRVSACCSPGSAVAQDTKSDPLPSWNDTAPKKSIIDFVEARHRRGGRRLRHPRRSASPSSTTTARCGPSSRSTSSSPLRSTASRPWRRKHPEWEQTEPFKSVLEGDIKAACCVGRAWSPRDHRGDPRRHHHREVRRHRRRLAQGRRASALQASLHRARLPADARAARLPARQRLQDLHRLGRRRRVHAHLRRARLRHPARAGRRLVGRRQVRDGRRRQARRS